MALATQCPHCGTAFRVAHDQLKLRSGLVRCGACKEIFNGIEHLLPAEEPVLPANQELQLHSSATSSPPTAEILPPHATELAAAAAQAIVTTPIESAMDQPDFAVEAAAAVQESHFPFQNETSAAELDPTEAELDETEATQDKREPTWESEMGSPWAPSPEPEQDPEPVPYDPLQRMTLMDVSHHAGFATEDASDELPDPNLRDSDDSDYASDELDQVIDDLRRKPLRRSRTSVVAPERDAADTTDFDEPDFITRARKKQHGRGMRVMLTSASLILLLGALAQGAYAFRAQIAAWFPPAKPALAMFCAELGCRIALPMQIESVTIESSELQALAPDKNTFSLGVLLRNRSATVEAWPNIELTLNDSNEQPVLRRVFLPREYLLPSQSEATGLVANSEQSVRIYFELDNLKAAGYRIYLFYS